MSQQALNVLGSPLQPCCFAPRTGFYRDGYCNTSVEDRGLHTVCVITTAAFLEFSKQQGNDLSTPIPEWEFPGLTENDRWCLCAARWKEAYLYQKAPLVILESTHERTLEIVSLEMLQEYQYKPSEIENSILNGFQ